MATRFYLDGDNAPAVTPPAPAAEWEHSGQEVIGALNSPSSGLASQFNVSSAYDGADDIVDKDAIVLACVSNALAAQTIASQVVSIQIQGKQTNLTNNMFLAWKIYLIDATGAAVAGGTILALRRDGTELTTTITNRGDSATSTEVTASSGDRIVVEVGFGGLPTATAGIDRHSGTAQIGEAGASGDLPVDDTTTDLAYNPWINFANTIMFQYTGTAAASFPRLVASATGTKTYTGTATAAFPRLTASATGAMLPSGIGSATFPHLTASATGTQTHTGIAAGSLSRLVAAATGTQTHSGAAVATLPRLTASATGTQTHSGTAGPTFSRLTVNGTGIFTRNIYILSSSVVRVPDYNLMSYPLNYSRYIEVPIYEAELQVQT